MKQVARLNPSRTEANISADQPVTFLPMEAVGTDGRARYDEPVPAAKVSKGFTYFRRGDILLAKITPCFENGKTALLNGMPTDVGFGSTEFHVLRPGPRVLPEYLHHVIRSDHFRRTGADEMTGAAGQQRVPTDFVAEYQFRLPPLEEQRAIARFLDRKSRRIARFIRARQRMIALLTEQNQAVIHQAVTRGLDPDVPLKASGIDWLGDIPAHWTAMPSAWLFAPRGELARADDVQLSATQAYGVIPQSEFEQKVGRRVVQVNLNLERRKHVEENDFVISMRSFQGGLERAFATGCIRSSYVVLKPALGVHTNYFAYLLKTPSYIGALQRTANFIRDGQDLNYGNFKQVPLPVPPYREQHDIAGYIWGQLEENATAAERYRREIELVREYRTRVIADVVTGQLDVRDHPDAAEHHPDDLDDPVGLDVTDGNPDGDPVDDPGDDGDPDEPTPSDID